MAQHRAAKIILIVVIAIIIVILIIARIIIAIIIIIVVRLEFPTGALHGKLMFRGWQTSFWRASLLFKGFGGAHLTL